MSAAGESAVRIGLSGWRYDGWRGVFYPQKLAQARELAFASRAVETVEINGSHYSLQSPRSYRAWHDATPANFVFSVKGPRYLTHMLRFRDETASVAMANFFASAVLALGRKLGPFLWQFPPNLAFKPETFERSSRCCRRTPRPRRSSRRATMRASRSHGTNRVVSECFGMPWRYAIRAFARTSSCGCCARTIFCYFDNDKKVQAPFDARRLMEQLGHPLPAIDDFLAVPARATSDAR
jgi:uncharacterized protein YecE (DUF72 family)